MNKKAIAYLIMSLAILSIVAANMGIFASRFRKIESSNIEVVSNEFVGSTLSDMTGPGMDKFMDVVSKKALQHLSVKLVEGNTYDSVEATFDSLVLDGSINSTVQYRYPTLNEFLGATTNYYHVLGFSITKVSINSTFSQVSPWRIIIDSKIRFKVSVPRTKYSGFFDLNTVRDVSLLGIEDPIGGFKVTNKWKNNESYPSFIDRLNGDSGADSEYGICRDCEGEYWGFQCTDEICDDGIDNDCDGDIDCDDPDCIYDFACAICTDTDKPEGGFYGKNIYQKGTVRMHGVVMSSDRCARKEGSWPFYYYSGVPSCQSLGTNCYVKEYFCNNIPFGGISYTHSYITCSTSSGCANGACIED